MQNILDSLKLKAQVVDIQQNGSMTKYFLHLHPGARVSKIERCATEIALAAKAYSVPIIRAIPEEGLVSVEMLTESPNNVSFNSLREKLYSSDDSLPIILGKTQDGEDLVADISIMPHLLIAGTTGSGKSIMLHSILSSLIESTADVKLALIDPKKVEFSHYENINQLMYPVVTEAEDALDILTDLVGEMEHRFKLMSKASVTSIDAYNRKRKNKWPYVVLVIDEFSDLMHSSKKMFQKKLCMLAQKSRACGIHIVIATQRPSVDVVTGLIKANFPARISCRVASSSDSRVVLGCNGAEKLLGKGDALIKSLGYDLVRFQGAFIDTEEVNEICETNRRSFWSRVRNVFR